MSTTPGNSDDQPPVRVDRRPDGVTVLTLNRPDRRNAMTTEVTEAWTAALADVHADPAVRAVVVTGAGSAFCAGGDLSWIAESPDLTVAEVRDRMLPFYRAWLALRDLPVPVLAAVNGAAIGAGLCLALAADLRYAARRARFSAPFTSLGMHAGMGATWLLPEAVGLPVARELLFTGKMLDASEAQRVGLINDIFDDDELLDRVIGVAGAVAAAAPVAVRLTKAGLAYGAPRSLEDALAWESLAQPVTLTTADLREGIAAQRERRAPKFTGR